MKLRFSWVIAVALLGCGDTEKSASSSTGGPAPTAAAASSAPPSSTTDAPLKPPDTTPVKLTPSACVKDVTSGQHAFECDGITYDVLMPPACANGGCGIILDVHGATMSSTMEENNTRMRTIGLREGYVVVQPSAPGTPPNAIWQPNRDYPKVWAFFDEIIGTYKSDPKRVHMMGFSQGGRMTFTFACAHADRIASAAPAAETGCSQEEAAAAAREVPMLYMHGKKDAIVPFALSAPKQRDQITSAWSLGTPSVVASDSVFTRTRYSNAKGTVFEFIEHDYTSPPIVLKGHCFPGSDDASGGAPGQLFGFACSKPTAFDWGEEAIAFFKAHPMP